MKATVVPAVNGTWEVKEIPTPEPSPIQVLIKIAASGLCYSDVHINQGYIPTEFPRTLEHETGREIVVVGEGVKTRQVGDRVGVPWVEASCGRCEWYLRGEEPFEVPIEPLIMKRQRIIGSTQNDVELVLAVLRKRLSLAK